MKTIDFSYFIERYLSGEMDDNERDWFKKELEGNEKLKKEVEFRQRTDYILKKQDVLNLRAKLVSIEKQRESALPERRHPRFTILKYAAAIAVLLTVGAITLIPNRKVDNNVIIEKYYKTYEATSSLRSGRSVENPDFARALEYYEVHDYRNAAVYFNRVIENSPDDMQSVLLQGISNFEISNYPEAKKSFVTVITDQDNLYIDHARWYLALCYIKTDERHKAAEQLAVIEKSKSLHRKDAKRILKKLD
jgi:tetratricopeptide (TPR) repeat protein